MRYACWDYGAALSALFAYHEQGNTIGHTSLERSGLNSLALALKKYVAPVRTLEKACGLIGVKYEPRTRPKGYWKIRVNQNKEVLNLAETLGKDLTELTKNDFEKHGLGGLLVNKYGNNVSRLLKTIGLVKCLTDMKKLPKDSMDNLKFRKAIIIKAITQSGDKPIESSDFKKYGVTAHIISSRGGLLKFIQDADPNFNPIYLLQLPFGYWQIKSNRIKAVRWLVKEKAGNDPYRVTYDTFDKNRLGNLVNLFGVSELLKEAGYPTTGRFEQDIWGSKQKVRKAIKNLLKITGNKKASDLHALDYNLHGYSGVLDAHGMSPLKARQFAGYDEDPELNKRTPCGAKKGHKRKEGSLYSNHGDLCDSYEERLCDDLLTEAGFGQHNHRVRYPGKRKRPLKGDMTSPDQRFWVEYAGMWGNRNKKRKKAYSARLKEKKRLARKHKFKLMIVKPVELKTPEKLVEKLRAWLQGE